MLPLRQPKFSGAFLLLVVSFLLLWEKTASVPACDTERGKCLNAFVNTFNQVIRKAEIINFLSEKLQEDFYENAFSKGQFAKIVSLMYMGNQAAIRAKNHCHSNSTNPPVYGPEHDNMKTKKYLKTLINFVGSWITPLQNLVSVLKAMKGVPENILAKAIEIQAYNREILQDLRQILDKVYPTAKMKEQFPSWEYVLSIKSNDKSQKFLAIFNLSHCLRDDTVYTKYHLITLRCRITGKDC